MIYDFSKEWDCNQFDVKVEMDKRLKKKVEYKAKSKKRSLSINAYLHVLICYFAIEYGETKEYVKNHFYKKCANRDIFSTTFQNKKQGYERGILRSSSDLTDKEMSLSIERFKDYSAKEAGILLPPADNKEFLEHCMNEIEKHAQYI